MYTLRPIGYFSLRCNHNISHSQSSAYFLYCHSIYITLHNVVLPLMTPLSVGDQPGTDIILYCHVPLFCGTGGSNSTIAVLLKRRAAHMQTASIKMRDNPSYNNPVVVELEERGVGTDYEDVDKDKEQVSSMVKNFDL